MKPKYCAIFNQPNRHGKEVAGLSQSQLIKTLMDKGFHTVSSIRYDDQNTGKVRTVEGKEMIAIWQHVYRAIRNRTRAGV